jgi:hypothetical protein
VDAYLAAGAERQQVLCNQAQADLGLPAISIEKDFWVCWTLREVEFNRSKGDAADLSSGSEELKH